MYFSSDIITPAHYAETIEILICHNLKGTVYIGGNHFELNGQQTFFIAPNIIHSIYYLKNEGFVTIVKLYPEGLLMIAVTVGDKNRFQLCKLMIDPLQTVHCGRTCIHDKAVRIQHVAENSAND